MQETMAQLRAIVEQRWPEIPARETHDVVMKIADRPWWVRFHAHCLGVAESEGADAGAWYLELRPLEENEMVPVGLIDDLRVAKALAYIHDNYCESLSLKKISETVGISLFHFHRLFSQHVGVTPKQYILAKQMQVARWMLRARNTPVSRIADNIGFASHGHFTSTFTRIVGMSPTEYRERVRSD
jgi:AraC-like DNA-binding protein